MVYQRVSSAFQRGGSFKIAIMLSDVAQCETTRFPVFCRLRYQHGFWWSSNATGNASSSSHPSDASDAIFAAYATYASMDQPAEQRLASWCKKFANDVQPRLIVELQRNLGGQGTASAIAAAAIQPSTLRLCRGTSRPLCFGRKQHLTSQYILIHFPGFVPSHGGKKKVVLSISSINWYL